MLTSIGPAIDFVAGGNGPDFQLHGWSSPEPGHTWTDGHRSAFWMDVPAAPLGYFIEFDCYPFLAKPLLSAQSITMAVNGRPVFSGEIRYDGVFAVRCPPPLPHDRKLVITIELPTAASPRQFGSIDARTLGIALRGIRLLPIVEEFPPVPRRNSQVRLTSTTRDGIADEAEDLTGLPIGDLVQKFEMLSGNCDMGVAQRAVGAEPLSLLRFAGAYPAVSIRGLDTGFAGIGEALDPWLAGDEWMIHDKYGMNYHSGQSPSQVGREQVIAMERRRIPFLLRKFREDLALGEKIFVVDRVGDTSAHAILPLYLALQRHGPKTMFWVSPARYDKDGGVVEHVLPNLYTGALFEFSPPLVTHVSVKGWVELMVNMVLLSDGGSGARNA